MELSNYTGCPATPGGGTLLHCEALRSVPLRYSEGPAFVVLTRRGLGHHESRPRKVCSVLAVHVLNSARLATFLRRKQVVQVREGLDCSSSSPSLALGTTFRIKLRKQRKFARIAGLAHTKLNHDTTSMPPSLYAISLRSQEQTKVNSTCRNTTPLSMPQTPNDEKIVREKPSRHWSEESVKKSLQEKQI